MYGKSLVGSVAWAMGLGMMLVACGGPDAKTGTGGDPPAAAVATFPGLDVSHMAGNVRVYLTDAPGDFDAVWVSMTGVDVLSAGAAAGDGGAENEGAWVSLTTEKRRLDLLTLQNEASAILGDATLAPGRYTQLRLTVDGGDVVVDGKSYPLVIPSGEQSGIKMNLGLEVGDQGGYALVVDFDAARSVRQAGDRYLLSPVLAVEFLGRVDVGGKVTGLFRRPKDPGQQGAEHQPADGGAAPSVGEAQQRRPDAGTAPQIPDAGMRAAQEPDARGGEQSMRPADAGAGQSMPMTGRP